MNEADANFVLNEIDSCLRRHGLRRRVAARIENNEVILTGRVTLYYEKQTAQESIRKHINGHSIRNLIEVV